MTKFFYDYEIVEDLLTKNNIINDKDRKELKNMSEEDLKDFHDRFGKEIRNIYCFFNTANPNTFKYGTGEMIKHPSELSFEIIEKTWKKLNNKEE